MGGYPVKNTFIHFDQDATGDKREISSFPANFKLPLPDPVCEADGRIGHVPTTQDSSVDGTCSTVPQRTADETAPTEMTTVYLKNVPNDHTLQDLIHLLNDFGFEGKSDFIYMPFEFELGKNEGYAFVNMI